MAYVKLPYIRTGNYYLMCTENGHFPVRVLEKNRQQFKLLVYNESGKVSVVVIITHYQFASSYVCKLLAKQVAFAWPEFYTDAKNSASSQVLPDG